MKKEIILFSILLSTFIFSLGFSSSQKQLSPSQQTEFQITIDNEFPIINIISPKTNVIYNNATPILINFTIFDLTLDSIWYSLNDRENITITSPFEINLSEGSYNLTVYVNDSFNRVSFLTINFTINNSILYCGNNFCSKEESCSTCSSDCGTCPTQPETTESGGGGSGEGSTTLSNSDQTSKNQPPPTTPSEKTAPPASNTQKETPQKTEEQKIKFSNLLYPLTLIPPVIIVIIILTKKFKKIKDKKENGPRRKK